MEDCDTWRTDEVPDEEIPEPPRPIVLLQPCGAL